MFCLQIPVLKSYLVISENVRTRLVSVKMYSGLNKEEAADLSEADKQSKTNTAAPQCGGPDSFCFVALQSSAGNTSHPTMTAPAPTLSIHIPFSREKWTSYIFYFKQISWKFFTLFSLISYGVWLDHMTTILARAAGNTIFRDMVMGLARISFAMKEGDTREWRRTSNLCYNICRTHVGTC